MKLTQNYSLKKPDLSDVADIEVLNGNMDIIDTQFKNFSTLLDSKENKQGSPTIYKNIAQSGGWDTSGCWYLKSNNKFVEIHLHFNLKSGYPFQYEVGTIPMGFRPVQLVNHATVVQTDTAFSPAQIWIDKNGKIILSWSNSTNSSIVAVAQDFIYMTEN